jgi:hypothetical protein
MKAPIEERIAAHPFWTGEVLTEEQWKALLEWRKSNPDLVFRHTDEVAEGRFFRNYHPRSRNGINAGTKESMEKAKEHKKKDYRENKERHNKKSREFREKNPGYASAYMKKWLTENHERHRASAIAYREANRSLCADRARDYYARNRNKVIAQKTAYTRERMARDEQFYLQKKMSARLRMALLNGQHKKSTRIDAESVEFLLWQAKKLGVDVRDYHVDHLFPISSFDLSDPKHQRVVNLPCNVWLMSEAGNLKKSDRFPTEEEIAAHGDLLEEWTRTRSEVSA